MKHVSQEEWKTILAENPSKSDLLYLIEYTDLKQEAWQQLLTQSPSNDDLLYLIGYTDLKQEAEKILNQNKKIIDIIKDR